MSLRMNLYGWSLPSFKRVLGSKDSVVFEAAAAHLAETLQKEPALSTARAWLRTLIESGFPLRQDRVPAPEPADGGLLTVLMETEAHVCVVDSIIAAIARDEDLDFANESSSWQHPAVGSLYEELASCGFTRSQSCCVEYFSWMAKLSLGSPLFGDDFRSQSSFYTVFSNQELALMAPVFRAAAEFERPLPKGFPDEAARTVKTRVSEGGREFLGRLVKWFDEIQRAGQDAFILWW